MATTKVSKKKKAEVADEVDETETAEGAGDEAAAKPKKAAKKARKAPTKRTKKSTEPPRIKLYWGVFNQNLKRVAVFEYDQKKDAEKHCKELSKAGTEHFLQKVRETIEA